MTHSCSRAPLSLNLMGKLPLPGLAKTRLIPELGAQGAAAAQARLWTHVAGVTRTWCAARPGRLYRLWCTPDTTHPLCCTLAASDQLRQQPPGDLGQRMALIAAAAASEASCLFLIGSDAASLTAADLDAAEQALTTLPAVLGPTEDGGYLLLGLQRPDPSLFQNVTWGTATVAAATRERFRALGWSWHELPLRWDVDTPADWQRFIDLNGVQGAGSLAGPGRSPGGVWGEAPVGFGAKPQ
ncbi:MAG: TIGR04282 family arsenosugar biosynthesis glycosyltransferase [Magnetococcales bacterium]|nr:TIGR04282 family arsenosugar biosynthesis glycosyltransferase [Magnetococcales bacterium]